MASTWGDSWGSAWLETWARAVVAPVESESATPGIVRRESDPWREVDWSLVQRRLEASVQKDRAQREARNRQKLLLLMAA